MPTPRNAVIDPIRRSDPEVVEFDWTVRLVAPWVAGRMVALGEVVFPLVLNGFFLECSQAGMTAAREPAWPSVAEAIVQDGSAQWTLKAPSSVSLPAIASAAYTITPAGITQSDAETDGLRTRVKLDASGADLGTHTIVAEIEVNGEDVSAELSFDVID